MVKFKVIDMARVFGVHRNTITNWIKKGSLGATPIVGRKYIISEEELISFAEKNNIPKKVILEFIEKNKVKEESVQNKVLKHRGGTKGSSIPKQSITREMGMMENKKVGSVLVLGGGIAGIQTVLDLADSGYFVHLVERSSSIGGVMAQLDKTFPTNDCAM